MDAVDSFAALQLRHQPSWDYAIQQHSTLIAEVCDDPKFKFEAIEKTYADLCQKFIESLLNSVRELLEVLPVQDLDLQTVGRPFLKRLLDTLNSYLDQEILHKRFLGLATGAEISPT